MKLRLLGVLLATAGLFVPLSVSASTQDFTFDSLDADYYLSVNSSKTPVLDVKETLVARFPNFDQNHGLLRAIPERYQDHTISLKIQSVTDENGRAYHYKTYKQNDNLVLQIGDAGSYVQGVHTYKINYEMRNVVNYQSDHDEFYWDINGDQWPQPFGQVTARIHIPASIASSLQVRQVCYTGGFGSQVQNCEMSRNKSDSETIVNVLATNLDGYQTLTTVIGFNKGVFVPGPEISHEKLVHKTMVTLGLIGGLVPPVLALMIMFRRWRQFGNDPKGRGVIIPEYEPPKGLDPLSSDFILSQALSSKAFSSMLIDQAVKRNLTIYEIPKNGLFGQKDYKLELNKLPSVVSKEVMDGLKLVFGDELALGTKISMNEFKKSSTMRVALYEGMKSLEKNLSSGLSADGYFIKDPQKVRSSYLAWSMLPFFAGISIAWVGAATSLLPFVGFGIGVLLAGIIMFGFAFIMPARTKEGVQAHDDLLGLKDYIKMAEADRLKYLQSPEGAEKVSDSANFNPKTDVAKIKLFEKLLPYAMLFGLEKDWAKQFADLYNQPRDWYQGNWSTFNAVYLANSLGGFNTSAGQSFSSPSSSSGSGFSGGSSGGGGGGGGGGGW